MKRKINSFSICVFSLFILFTSCNTESIQKKEEKPVTFTFFSSDANGSESFNDLIAREITKRTGVKLEFVQNSKNASDAISLMIAGDQFPDFIFAKGDLSRLVEAEAVIPLDDYIEKYGQNVKKLYGDELVKLRYNTADPSIYTVGTYEIKTRILETSGSLQLQNAVLREFGYPVVRTLDDYENILKAYIKKYPEINGHKTIGLSLLTDSWYWYLSLSNPGNYLIGFPDDGQWIVDQKTMKATYKFLYPEIKLYYRWLNRLYHEGLLDPESFTQNEALWKSKMEGGYVLGTSYPLWGLSDIKIELEKNDMASRTMAYLSVTADERFMDPSLKDYGFSGGWGIAISEDCSDPVRAFKFLDWFCSEEAQVLVNWGILDKHYYYSEDGQRLPFTGYPVSDGVGNWLYPFPEAGSGYIDSTGNPIGKNSPETIQLSYSVTEKNTLHAYGADLWVDLFPPPEKLGVSKHGQVWQYPLNSQMNEVISAADDYVRVSLIKMIVSPTEDFYKSWENMVSHLKEMGVDEVGEQVTELIQDKQKLWEKE